MLPGDGRVGAQNAAYRQGLVLGLTMAEVGILIIFVLMLLIGYQQVRLHHVLRQLQGKVGVAPAQLSELIQARATVDQIALALGIRVNRPPEDFRRLVRAVQAAAASPAGRSAQVQAKQALEEIQSAAAQMRAIAAAAQKGGSAAIVQAAEAQSYRIANQEGQLQRYEKQLADAGQGKGQRPCWVEPDGSIDYLYDVALASNGIRMRERTYPGRAAERAHLPIAAANPQEVLTESEFLRRTDALFRYSESLNCRFFVVVYDATAVQEKPLYKSELRTVEGHFYKLLSSAAAPF